MDRVLWNASVFADLVICIIVDLLVFIFIPLASKSRASRSACKESSSAGDRIRSIDESVSSEEQTLGIEGIVDIT